jgi:hypothetical protein
MTDRAQPGAIDSLVRNDELAQALDSFTQGGIVSGSNPTDASVRRSDIDETVLDAFSLSSSASSLDVTIAPGEAFVAGWLCRDTSTTLTLPSNATTDIIIGYATDAIFDPSTDPDRDAADEVIVDLSSNVPPDIPQVIAHRVETDGSGVVSSSRVATVDAFSQVDAGTVQADTINAADTETTDLTVNGTTTGIDEFADGDNYDGLGTGDFSNLSSLNVSGPASVGDLTVNGTLTGFTRLITVQTEADLPAVDPPQLAFVVDQNEYQLSRNEQGFSLDNINFQQQFNQRNHPNVTLGDFGDVEFSPDGTKFYQYTEGQLSGRTSRITEYNLSTPFDVSTATFVQSINGAEGIDGDPTGLIISPDGTQLYESDILNNLIFQRTLSTPFDISTASNQQSIQAQAGSVQGIAFDDDFSRLFEVDKSPGPGIIENTLTTDFDITTASFQSSTPALSNSSSDIAFSDDGTRMFELSESDNLIFERQLTAPFSIETSDLTQSVQTAEISTVGLAFEDNGTRLFEVTNSDISESTLTRDAGFSPVR